MDLDVVVGVCFYQDAKGLQRLSESLLPIPFIRKIYAVDGRFAFPDFGSAQDPELSTDLGGYTCDKLEIINFANVTEWRKRQRYLEECYKEKPDFLFILDTDEYISYNSEFESHLKQIKQQMIDDPTIIYHNVYDVHFNDTTQGIKNLKPRIWFRPSQMTYTDWMAFRNRQYIHYHTDPSGSMYPIGIIRGITIIHDKTLRTNEYETKNREYHRRQVAPMPNSNSTPTSPSPSMI